MNNRNGRKTGDLVDALRYSLTNDTNAIKVTNDGIIFTNDYVLPLKPTNVIFNNPATIVFWNDGTKTVVKCSKDDVFNEFAGFTMAYLKKTFGSGQKAEKFVNENFSKELVFSKKRFYEIHKGLKTSSWVEDCHGLTKKQMTAIGYVYDDKWFVERKQL